MSNDLAVWDAAFDNWVNRLTEHDYAYDAPKKALHEAWNACVVTAMRLMTDAEIIQARIAALPPEGGTVDCTDLGGK